MRGKCKSCRPVAPLSKPLPFPTSSSVEVSTLDDSAWQTGEIALSAGWSLLSITNPSANVLNETQAALLMPLLSSAVNNSLAWTSTADATLGFNFSGTDLAVYGPLSPMVGSFEPFLDGLSLGVVRAGVNVDARDDITGGQLVWSSSGLADGSHRFEMRNAGDGGDGVLLVDSFCIAGVTNRFVIRNGCRLYGVALTRNLDQSAGQLLRFRFRSLLQPSSWPRARLLR